MLKLLVTTDFSNASKAGLRFAAQLAAQHPCALTFFHSYHKPIPTSWSEKKMETYKQQEAIKIQQALERFVAKVLQGQKTGTAPAKYVIAPSVFAEVNIMEYAAAKKFNFICISTRGAGKFKRVFGTNTGNLINNSTVPVIAVPHTYRRTRITRMMYASDLLNMQKELRKVMSIATPLHAKVELFHVTSPLEQAIDPKVIEIAAKKLASMDILVNIKNTDYGHTLVSTIKTAIAKIKPSMLIMFTEQNRTLFQKIFLPAKSTAYSFDAKIPVLVFNKS